MAPARGTPRQAYRRHRRMLPASGNASNSQGFEAVLDLSWHRAEALGGLARSPRENGLRLPAELSSPSVNATQSSASEVGALGLVGGQLAAAHGLHGCNAPWSPPWPDALRRYQRLPQNKESSHNHGTGSPVPRA